MLHSWPGFGALEVAPSRGSPGWWHGDLIEAQDVTVSGTFRSCQKGIHAESPLKVTADKEAQIEILGKPLCLLLGEHFVGQHTVFLNRKNIYIFFLNLQSLLRCIPCVSGSLT